MSKIVDGYTGKPNVFPDVIGEHNISMYGSGDYVLSVGECLGYELVSNNEIRIKDGLFITQGRRGYIEKGTTDICTIENGAQAVNRNDLIIIEYVRDETTLMESHTTKVIKGTAGEEAVDPEIVTGDIPNGAVLHQMPLYRVKIEGLNVVAVEQLFEFGSVAAETVDPMAATEPGFAADAYLTRLELEECFQSVSNGKALLASAIADKGGDVDASDTFEVMANAIEQFILSPKSQTGTFTVNVYSSGTYTHQVLFDEPFGAIPEITVVAEPSYAVSRTISNVTVNGFDVSYTRTEYGTTQNCVFTWVASLVEE